MHWQRHETPVLQCCGKATWQGSSGATRKLKHLRKTSKAAKVPVRVYQCSFGGWHLTSQPRKVF